jgi:predicted DNA-binding protein
VTHSSLFPIRELPSIYLVRCPVRSTSFAIPESLYRRVNLAAARVGASSSEYIRGALWAALETHAENDPVMARIFSAVDELERQDEMVDA